jgi:hypothetical protein
MVTNNFGNESLMQPMRRLSIHLGGVRFLSSWGGDEQFVHYSHHVPMELLSTPQKLPQLPKVFLITFPIAPHFYPIWFAQSSILMYLN